MTAADEIPFDAGVDYDLSAATAEVRREMRKQLLSDKLTNQELSDLVYRALTLSEHEAVRMERARLRNEIGNDHFDVLWHALREDKFAKIAQRISIHDARTFFKSMRDILINAAGLSVRERDQ